jgi:hypothetical protein
MRYGGQRACNPAVSAVSTTFVLFSSGNRPKLGTMKLFLNRRGTATQNGAAPTQLCADLRPPATLGTSPTSVDVAVNAAEFRGWSNCPLANPSSRICQGKMDFHVRRSSGQLNGETDVKRIQIRSQHHS